MCGIAGYVASDGLPVDEGHDLIARMLAALVHRGPDGAGRYVDAHCGLGSTRLAIVDVEHGHMPNFSEDRQIVSAMNGEIYNYRPLRQQLGSKGHVFASQSDSEVLPHLYEECGPDLAERLTGMFAFALWDRRERRLLLARDRFGIKPLFVTRARGLLLYASEVKALLATGYVDAKIDVRALADLGTAGHPMPPRTMFRGVESLLPGCCRTIAVAGADVRKQYYTVPYPSVTAADLPAISQAAAVDRTRALFDEVVGDHLMGDVPVGGLVSGGLDSVSVAARAAALANRPLSTFSMTFSSDDHRFDESRHSDAASRAIASPHQQVPQDEVEEDDYRGTIRAMEAPQLSTIPFCEYRLARAVHRAGLKVVLTGEGADETFAGYETFKKAKARRNQSPDHLAASRATSDAVLNRDLHTVLSGWWNVEPAVEARYGFVPPAGERWWTLANTWQAALDPAMAEALSIEDGSIEHLPERPPCLRCEDVRDALHRDLLFEQRTRLDGWVLVLGDRLTMAHSVEGRLPFLDHRLVDLTTRVPSELLLCGFREKHLLREAMAGRIPDSLRLRPKQGFDSPVQRWLFTEPRPSFVRAALAPDALRRLGVFHADGLARLSAWLAHDVPAFRRTTAAWTMNMALGLQIFSEEFHATL